MTNLKFSQIFNKNFKTFLHYVNKFANEMLFFASNTIKSKVHLLFHKSQKRLRHLLYFVIFLMHITCDV